jgi:hypothetical protein
VRLVSVFESLGLGFPSRSVSVVRVVIFVVVVVGFGGLIVVVIGLRAIGV